MGGPFPALVAAVMSIAAFIVVGLVAGFLASKIVTTRGLGMFRDILLGVVGALVGGFIFSAAGTTGVTGFNVWILCATVVGSIIVLGAYHALVRRPATKA
jgi:uncharacterized membrane protein YeaQ/YmgE (transglycosylase-associated protein family)